MKFKKILVHGSLQIFYTVKFFSGPRGIPFYHYHISFILRETEKNICWKRIMLQDFLMPANIYVVKIRHHHHHII